MTPPAKTILYSKVSTLKVKEMSIAIVGSGAIGLYYGGRLAAAGRDVRFLLRSGYEEAKERGIRIHAEGDLDVHVRAPKVFRTSGEIGPVDLVIIAIKATGNAALDDILPPLLHDGTMLLTLQNGLGNDDTLAEKYGAPRVLGGLCFICLNRITPASVNHLLKNSLLSLGEYARPPQPRTRALAGMLQHSGARVKLARDLAEERWRKLVWNIPFNGLAVAEGGLTVDRILADPALEAETRALMDEVIAAANALGHVIEPAYTGHQIERTYPMGPYKPSTLVDWLAGYELEIEPIWGEPLRRAKKAGVAVPHLETLYHRLKTCQPCRQ